MTRDESIKIFETLRTVNQSIEANWIDIFIGLGMLKLDEPKSFEQKLHGFLSDSELQLDGIGIRRLQEMLERNGLKIVEK